jgi:hypothetical protein
MDELSIMVKTFSIAILGSMLVQLLGGQTTTPPGEELPPNASALEVLKYFVRPLPHSASEAFSGWMGISCPYVPPAEGTFWNIAVYGANLQVGVVIRNNDSVPHTYKPTVTNYHWTSEATNDFVTDVLVIGDGEPEAVPPAPTGMPFANYEYEPIDKIIPLEGAVLQPGEVGFFYTEAYSQSRRYNTVSMMVDIDGTSFGPYILISGWYSY